MSFSKTDWFPDGSGVSPVTATVTMIPMIISPSARAIPTAAMPTVPTRGRHHRCTSVRAIRWKGTPSGVSTVQGRLTGGIPYPPPYGPGPYWPGPYWPCPYWPCPYGAARYSPVP